MPIVAMPDGAQVRFPDDMPPDQIRSLILQKFPDAEQRAAQGAVTIGGLAKAAGRGLIDAATGLAGLPGALDSAVQAGLNATIGPMPPESQAAYERTRLATPADLEKRIESVTGPLPEPQNKAEEYARTIAGMVPAVVAGPGGIVRRAIEQVALPGAAAQAAGDIPGIKGTAAEPVARLATAVASPVAAERLITPLSTSPSRAAAVRNLRNEGVDVSAGQSSGSKFLRKSEEELGGSTTQALAERQAEQFTAATMRRVGENAERATPDVVDAAFRRIGNNMNNLAANNNLVHDRTLTDQVIDAVRDYNDLVPPSLRSALIQRVERAVNQNNANTLMSGEQYQSLRSRLGSIARGLAKDPEQQRAVYRIQSVFDDAMERSIRAQNPDMLGEWRQARTEYRNMLAIEKAVNYQGEAAQAGLITPQNLARALKQVQGQRAYSTGRTDLAVLARNGSEVMAPLANSNTASRARIHAMLAIPGAAVGAGEASNQGLGLQGVLGGALAGALVPRLAGEAIIRGRKPLGNALITARQTLPANALRATLGGLTGR